jgi:hypothetical protein
VTVQPDNAQIASGALRQYSAPASFGAARVNATWVDPTGPNPDGNAYDKIELTIGGGSMNYNITYVDWLALPVRAAAVDSNCPQNGGFNPTVSCNVPVASVLSGCPAGLLDGKRCLSAGLFCSIGANQSSAFCHALDNPLQTCEAQNPSTCGIAGTEGDGTPNVYGCSGYFDSQPPAHPLGNQWCAALNRGMLSDPTNTNAALYYKNAPFNTYAKWVHDTCPGIYAFPYDDFPSNAGQSGFRSCTANRLDVTFCPAG